MLIKAADDQNGLLAELEAQAQRGGAEGKRAALELRIRRAGLRAEREAAYLIDFDYARSSNWAVIHDLRLEHGGRVAQIDHLLINRWMDIYVLETKSFHAGVKITEDGEFLRWNDFRKTYEGMASPIQQNERHIEFLRDVITRIELPTRLGLKITPAFHSFVLVSPKAKVYRPKKFDASRVIKADQLKKAIWRDIDNENGLLGLLKTAAKIVSSETVEAVARQLAARHRPLRIDATPVAMTQAGPDQAKPSGRRIEPVFPAKPPAAPAPDAPVASAPQSQATASASDSPRCKTCQGGAGSILSGRYGYYFKCAGCDTNTGVRFTCAPGHTPRLRGEQGTFHRDCAQCGTSTFYFRNPPLESTP